MPDGLLTSHTLCECGHPWSAHQWLDVPDSDAYPGGCGDFVCNDCDCGSFITPTVPTEEPQRLRWTVGRWVSRHLNVRLGEWLDGRF